MAKSKLICVLSWSVLLSTTTTRHFSFPYIFSYCFYMLSEFAKGFERKVWRVKVAHLHNAARALSSLSRCFQLSTNLERDFFRYLWYCGKKKNRMSFSMALVKFHWFNLGLASTDMFFYQRECKNCTCCWYYIIVQRNRAAKQIWKILPNMIFPPIWGEKMAAFQACACKLS